jgi:hypothetical protein
LLGNNVILIITIKKVSVKIHQKCPQKFTQKDEFSWTKSPREFTYFVHENSPFMSTRSLPPQKTKPLNPHPKYLLVNIGRKELGIWPSSVRSPWVKPSQSLDTIPEKSNNVNLHLTLNYIT